MSLKKVKAFLTLLMALGAVAYFGGDGTLASFSAQTTNVGNAITSGTLTMSDAVTSGTTCFSEQAATKDNNNGSCGVILTLPNATPGLFGGIGQVTIKDTGSIDARDLWLGAPSQNATASISSGSSTLSLSSVPTGISKGQAIVVNPAGTPTQTFYATAAVAATSSPASVSVTPSASSTFSSGTAATVRDCYDQVSSTPGITGATAGSALNFNSASGNPLCAALVLYVQEVGQTAKDGTQTAYSYCWYGKTISNSQCYAPISTTLPSALSTSGAITNLPVATINGNVVSGDKIVVTSGTNTQTFVANGSVTMGAAASGGIPIQSATPNFAYPIGSTVTDTSDPTFASGPLQTLDSDSVHTLANFDSSYDSGGGIQLARLTASGTLADTSITQLPAGSSRTFDVGIFLPAPTAKTQNALQGLQSTFGLNWHIDQ